MTRVEKRCSYCGYKFALNWGAYRKHLRACGRKHREGIAKRHEARKVETRKGEMKQ